MNYGEKAKDLILQLKRSEWLPPYNDEGVRSSLKEVVMYFDELNDQFYSSNVAFDTVKSQNKDKYLINNYYHKIDNLSKKNNAYINTNQGSRQPIECRPAIILFNSAIKRIKRCLLGYHYHRLDKLKVLRWETNTSIPLNIRALLSDAEVDFFNDYDRIVSQFSNTLTGINGFLLDLNSNMQPPEEDMIEVRVIRDGMGTIVTEHWGEVNLEFGSTHFLCRTDVEHLIRQGMLQQLDSEETS